MYGSSLCVPRGGLQARLDVLACGGERVSEAVVDPAELNACWLAGFGDFAKLSGKALLFEALQRGFGKLRIAVCRARDAGDGVQSP